MSKLLLSTSMVVALMTIGTALHAADPQPMPVNPAFGDITVDPQQQTEIPADEAILQSVEQLGNAAETAGDAEMKALLQEKGKFSADSKKAFEDLKNDHEELEKAIKVAKEADNPEAQGKEFKKVEDAMTQVDDSAKKLADELKKQEDTQAEKSANSIVSDAKDELSAEKEVASYTKALENIDETQGESRKVAEDQKLTSGEDMKIAVEMKDKIDEIQKSVDAAGEIQQGLVDSGLDANDDKLIALIGALQNLNKIVEDIKNNEKDRSAAKN